MSDPSREPVALLLAGIGLTPEAAGEPDPAPAPHPGARELDARLEALLMAAESPMPLAALASALDRPIAVLRQAVERVRADYDGEAGGPRRGFELREVATGWRLGIRAEHAALVREHLADDAAARLSQAALETLTVIAYRQPVTRGGVAAVRAVSVDAVVRTLQARGLIEVVGRVPETGAALYGTTDALLVALGIGSVEELPAIAHLLAGTDEVAELAG